MSLIDMTNVQAQQFTPLAPGKYRCAIVDSKVEPIKSGQGKKLSVCFSVLDEPNAGRKIFSNFNFDNPSEKAKEIALAQLKNLSNSIGLGDKIESAEDLLGKTVIVNVGQKQDHEGVPRAYAKYFEEAGSVQKDSDFIPF
jgi:hypothetical protein